MIEGGFMRRGVMRRGNDMGGRIAEGRVRRVEARGNVKGNQAGSYEGTETT